MRCARLALFFSLVWLASFPCLAREGNSERAESTRLPYRQLTWSDFRVDDVSRGFSAQTETFLTYGYTARVTGRDGQFEAIVLKITFTGGFDRTKSWRRSSVSLDDAQLLEHEQGHLDINELKVRQLQALGLIDLPTGRGSTAKAALNDLNARLTAFQREQRQDMDRTQKRYDAETRFGTDQDQQHVWSARLRQALKMLSYRVPGAAGGAGRFAHGTTGQAGESAGLGVAPVQSQ
jgi:hypothetical protein